MTTITVYGKRDVDVSSIILKKSCAEEHLWKKNYDDDKITELLERIFHKNNKTGFNFNWKNVVALNDYGEKVTRK